MEVVHLEQLELALVGAVEHGWKGPVRNQKDTFAWAGFAIGQPKLLVCWLSPDLCLCDPYCKQVESLCLENKCFRSVRCAIPLSLLAWLECKG